MKNCVIVIPTLNPSDELCLLIKGLVAEGYDCIICIDDGSNPMEIFSCLEQAFHVEVIRHAINMGKGRALKTAFNYVLNNYPDKEIVITVDDDGQHTVEGVNKIYNAYNGSNQLILGKRDFKNNKDVKIPLRSKLGNKLTKIIFNYLCNIDITDTQTGIRGYPINILPFFLNVIGERYEYETNCLLMCKEKNIPIKEVRVETIYKDDNQSSHFNPVRDSLKIYIVILKYICSSSLAAIIDYFIFISLSFYFTNVFAITYTARLCASIVNFTINKRIVFKQQGNLRIQWLKYMLLLIISGAISAIAIFFLDNAFHINLLITKLLVEFVLFFFNFYIQKNAIFVKRNKCNDRK